jgi:hypothetical protein
MTALKEEDVDLLNNALLQYPLAEHEDCRTEASHHSHLVLEYSSIKPERKHNPKTGKAVTPEIRHMCERSPQAMYRAFAGKQNARLVTPVSVEDVHFKRPQL